MKWSKKKTAIAGVVGVCAIASLFSGGKDVETINISIPDYQEEYDINTDIPVEIAVEPGDADTNNLKYETDSYHIDFSESGINTGSSEGTYEVYVSSGDIQSNTLSITVVDMTKRAEEEAEAERLAEEQRLAEEKAAQEAEAQRLAEEQAAKEAEEKRLAEEKAAQEAAAQAAAEKAAQEAASQGSSNSSGSAGNGENFNTYNNADQQQTSASYVLNTNTHKFHYPSCKSVKKIAPQNYSTSNSSRDELIAQGYDPCGNCHP